MWKQMNKDKRNVPKSTLFPAAINAGKIIAYWNLPHTSYSSPDPVLADRVTYDTLIRTISPFNNLAKGLVTVFQKQKVLWPGSSLVQKMVERRTGNELL